MASYLAKNSGRDAEALHPNILLSAISLPKLVRSWTNLIMRIIVIIAAVLVPIFCFGKSDCEEWFEEQHFIDPENCVIDCFAQPKPNWDMDLCVAFCQKYCDEKFKLTGKQIIGKVLYYPGLTKSEKGLVEKYPKNSITVFLAKELAEIRTEKRFPKGKMNDESDAFRHFVWAGLLVKEIGDEKAQEYLNAHEDNPTQPEAEKAMDLANNRGGILAPQSILKKGELTLEKIEAEALKQIVQKKLVILKPSNEPIGK